MKILMITKVKNESDIIEYFLRYHSFIFDNIVVIDNGSLDGTYEIINELIKEGLCIELINEAYNDFDAFRMANQYTKHLLTKHKADFVVFMDADEFLITNGWSNPRDYIKKLDPEKIHSFMWRTYIYDGNDNACFSPDCFNKFREEAGESFKKIIISRELVDNKSIVVSAGNHSAFSKYEIEEEYHNRLKFAHFPIRSMHQRKKQIIINTIDIMSNPDENKHTGEHWKKMYESEKVDLYEESMHYAFYTGDRTVDNPFLDIFNVKVKYQKLIKSNLERLMIEHSEIQALKMKKMRIDKNIMTQDWKEKVVVWGTGEYAGKMVERIDDYYRIELYVDANREKCFSMFHNKMIIPPETLRFFDFSYIIIASTKYENEIRKQICEVLPYWNKENIFNIDEFIIYGYHKRINGSIDDGGWHDIRK